MVEKKETSKRTVAEQKSKAQESVQKGAQAPELARADPGRRIAAALLDGVPAYVIAFVPFIGWLISAAYLALRDALPLSPEGGQSIGKKLLQLRAVRMPDGTPCDYGTSLLRNLPFVVPPLMMIRPGIGWFFGSMIWLAVFVVETLLVIADESGQRIGDRLAKTMVIEIKT